MRDPARVRAVWHPASDSPPCVGPIDLPRVQALGQELFFLTFLAPQEHVKYDAFQNNGKRLQRGGPPKTAEWEACITEPWRPLPLQPFLDTASSTVFYVLLEVLWTPRFTYSCACFGARILRCVGGTKRGAEGEAFLGPPTPRILRTPGHAQEHVKCDTKWGTTSGAAAVEAWKSGAGRKIVPGGLESVVSKHFGPVKCGAPGASGSM